MCLINTHILIYWHVGSDCKLWRDLWLYCIFWVFSYIIIDYSCLKCCIFTKYSLIICPINTYIFLCWYAPRNHKLWKILWYKKFSSPKTFAPNYPYVVYSWCGKCIYIFNLQTFHTLIYLFIYLFNKLNFKNTQSRKRRREKSSGNGINFWFRTNGDLWTFY